MALTLRLRSLHAQYYGTDEAVTDEMAAAFLKEELDRAGAEEMITPREIIRDFIEVLDIVYQNPGLKVRELLGSDRFQYAQNAVLEEATEAEFAEFTV